MVESPPKKVGQEIDLEDPLYLAPPVCFTTVYYVFYASLVLTTVLLLLTTRLFVLHTHYTSRIVFAVQTLRKTNSVM